MAVYNNVTDVLLLLQVSFLSESNVEPLIELHVSRSGGAILQIVYTMEFSLLRRFGQYL